MPQYTSRDVGDPSQIKKNKQSMADLKLRRLTELNNRLREDLERERIPVSTAAKRCDRLTRLRVPPLLTAWAKQHHCLLYQHEGLHGAVGMEHGAQGRRPVRPSTIGWLLCRHVGGGKRPLPYFGSSKRRPSMMIFGDVGGHGDGMPWMGRTE